jgi:hypothetical protein
LLLYSCIFRHPHLISHIYIYLFIYIRICAGIKTKSTEVKSSLGEVSAFGNLNWGLENVNTFSKKRSHVCNIQYLEQHKTVKILQVPPRNSPSPSISYIMWFIYSEYYTMPSNLQYVYIYNYIYIHIRCVYNVYIYIDIDSNFIYLYNYMVLHIYIYIHT